MYDAIYSEPGFMQSIVTIFLYCQLFSYNFLDLMKNVFSIII
jgi:hypothetical protein